MANYLLTYVSHLVRSALCLARRVAAKQRFGTIDSAGRSRDSNDVVDDATTLNAIGSVINSTLVVVSVGAADKAGCGSQHMF